MVAQRVQTCKLCEPHRTIKGGNLARHVRDHHSNANGPARPRVQEMKCVSDVLNCCGIEDFPWPIAHLDRLPNLRHRRPELVRHHTPWDFLPEQDLEAGITVQGLVLELRAYLSQGKKFSWEAWNGNTRLKPNKAAWKSWCEDVLCMKPQQMRVINGSLAQLATCQQSEQTIRARATSIIAEMFPNEDCDELQVISALFNITPKGTWTEVHHDSSSHISQGMGLDLADRSCPLKLWIVWPSLEIEKLARCYSDTTRALTLMEHGSFFVQMPGDVLVAPPNSPHAVYALSTCVLFGPNFYFPSRPTDPCSLRVDLRVGMTQKEAWSRRLSQLQLGLVRPDFRQAFLDHFEETWVRDVLFPRTQKQFSQLLSLCQLCMRTPDGRCLLCGRLGVDEQHMREHLEQPS